MLLAVFPSTPQKKADVKVEADSNVAQVPATTTKIEISRFREWKASPGTFGGENHVDYCSLVVVLYFTWVGERTSYVSLT